MNKQALKIALIHLLKVFLWSGFSAIIPLLIAYLENDPRWAALTPVFNAVLYSFRRYLNESIKK